MFVRGSNLGSSAAGTHFTPRLSELPAGTEIPAVDEAIPEAEVQLSEAAADPGVESTAAVEEAAETEEVAAAFL